MNATDTAGTRDRAKTASPRAIEVGFPIVEINRLAAPERNSFKPIYQMHKWFARRASCVFRAILLGALKPAVQPDGTPTDLMAEFYKNHADDPDTKGSVVLDPFMGGGTSVVEALRLGCKVIGVDLNPVAWFVVKSEVEPVDLPKLNEAFERLAERPVGWANGKPLREALSGLYKSEIAPGIEADVVNTFWVKHAICTDQGCKKEVPLFKDYLVAYRTATVRYWRDIACPECGNAFDWEIQPAALVAERALMVNASRGSGGEGRPAAVWVYAPEPNRPKRKKERSDAQIDCPSCSKQIRINVPWDKKKERKKVALTVLLCPACEAVWQWRGPLPTGKLACPSCKHEYDPLVGNVPKNGVFQCSCGNQADVLESVRLLQKHKRLPMRPYAIQAYLPVGNEKEDQNVAGDGAQHSLFGDGTDRQETLPLQRQILERESLPKALILPENGKFFKRLTVTDRARLSEAEQLWEKHKQSLPYPKSEVPYGDKTKTHLLGHHYNYWHELFTHRQLLALSTLLDGIAAEQDRAVQEMLLSAFFSLLEGSNFFARFKANQNKSETAKGIFARHDFHPKNTPVEDNVWGADTGKGFRAWFDIVMQGKEFAYRPSDNTYRIVDGVEELERIEDGSSAVFDVSGEFRSDQRAILRCQSSSELPKDVKADVIITDPPYVGNVNYAELADFFYVWLRLVLKSRYECFAPEYTEKGAEIVENSARGKSRATFYRDLAQVYSRIHSALPEHGLMAFTFHHTDQEGEVWEGLLQALCDTGFEVAAVYPVQSESETSSHHQDMENISYDLIHVCRKRQEDPTPRSWAGIRQEVRRRARTELTAIEEGRYGGKPLAEPDVRLICIGKCLELYSAHYNHVLDHEGKPLPLHRALQDISAIVDQLVTRERPLPAELENVDPLSYVWLRCLMPRRAEVTVDSLSKDLRALRVSIEDVKNAGLVVRGRTGRGRTYEVKQPEARLEAAMDALGTVNARQAQTKLFDDAGRPRDLMMVDLWQALIALASAGESVLDLLEQFRAQWPEIAAGLRYCRTARSDWERPIARVLAIMEGAPLLERQGAA
ncbi:MAG: DUF1156 domain-containing protein [Betaproteobacteria bacterium]